MGHDLRITDIAHENSLFKSLLNMYNMFMFMIISFCTFVFIWARLQVNEISCLRKIFLSSCST